MSDEEAKEDFPDNDQRLAFCFSQWENKRDHMQEIERRYIRAPSLEPRAEGDTPPKVVGYAAIFDALSDDLGGFREKIAPGAFAKSLGGDVKALFNHDPNRVLGRSTSKTLRLQEDNRGLLVEFEPPNTAEARGVLELIRRGDVDQMSFGFRVKPGGQKWEDQRDGTVIRTLTDVELFDVSVVTFPAYPQTEAYVRGLSVAKVEFDKWLESVTAPAKPLPDFSLMRRKLRLASA